MSAPAGYSAAAEVGQVRTRRSRVERAWIELRKAPLTAWIGMAIILFYLVLAVFAPLIAPHGEAEVFAVPSRRGTPSISSAPTRSGGTSSRG